MFVYVSLRFFFFQAEDGIRDFCLSRGLGDVYKRQLPYCRTYHPSYKKLGGIPAIREIEFSLTSCRGCFGACSFCALTFHQGRIIQTRSHASILQEAEAMTHAPGFKGYIHDVGGPTANFRQPACKKQLQRGACPGLSLIHISEPTRQAEISYAVFCLKKKKKKKRIK